MADPTVVLIHGFATSAQRTWREPGWVDLLADAGRTVVAPDLLGHGLADKPHDPEAYADLEGGLLAELPDEPVDAIGYSMGGRILLGMASRAPERFRKLVVAGIGDGVLRSERTDAVARAVEGDFDPENRTLAHFNELAHVDGNDPAALAAFMRREVSPLRTEDLAQLTMPVLVVLGEQDFAWPADDLVTALPQGRFLPLPKVDHFGTPKDFTFIDEALGFIDARPF